MTARRTHHVAGHNLATWRMPIHVENHATKNRKQIQQHNAVQLSPVQIGITEQSSAKSTHFATETSLIKNSRTSPYYPKTSLKKRVIATLYCASARTSEGFYAARTYWNKRNQCLLFSFRDLNGDIAKFHNAELGRDLPVCQLHRDGRRNWSDELDQTRSIAFGSFTSNLSTISSNAWAFPLPSMRHVSSAATPASSAGEVD